MIIGEAATNCWLMEIPRYWRLRQVRLSDGWRMPVGVARLWQTGEITLAQATSPRFWESDLCERLLRTQEAEREVSESELVR